MSDTSNSEIEVLRGRMADLQAEVARFRATFYSIGEAVIATDGLGGILQMNPLAEELTGWREAEALEKPLAEVFRIVETADPLERVLREGAVVNFAKPMALSARDGTVRPIAGSLTPIREAEGRVVGAVLVFRDQTLERQIERQRREVEDRFRYFFDNAPIGKSMTSPEGKLLHVNAAFAALLGYSLEEIQSLNFASVTHPDDLPESRECVRALLAGERDAWTMEKRYLAKDGHYVWTLVKTRLQRDDQGRALCFLTHMLDITEKKQAEDLIKRANEALVRSNAELEQFAYVASHDLQEPLRMVSSFTQLLAKRYRDKLDQDALDFIGYAVDGANRMQRLIQDLLSFSRVSTRGQPPVRFDAHDALGEAVSNLQAGIQETGALVTNEELPWVIGDRTQIVQVFQNLLGNGIKFRRLGEPPRIRLDAERSTEQPGFWTFKVTDNGIGIEPRHFERLFVIFQRLHSREEYPGTGIGLALCKRIVERHGGRIWLESEAGQGTTFYFTLPAGEPNQGGPQ